MEEFFINTMQSFPFGKVLLVIIGLSIIILPILEKTCSLFSGAAERKKKKLEAVEKKQEEATKKALEQEKFKNDITTMVEEVPKLNSQIGMITDQLQSFTDLTQKMAESTIICNQKLEKLQEDISEIRNTSNTNDEEIVKNLASTNKAVTELSEKMESVNTQVSFMIESDIDEFRTHLMNCYTKYVINGEPLDRQTKQILKTKFKRYAKEGGNGWAAELMDELLKVDVQVDFANISSNQTDESI